MVDRESKFKEFTIEGEEFDKYAMKWADRLADYYAKHTWLILMKTPISFVQPNFQTGPKHLNAFYLPYTSGVLWAYARQNKKIKR